jgi:hypothetical protein
MGRGAWRWTIPPWRSDLDLEPCRRPKSLNPAIFLQPLEAHRRSLVQRFGLDVDSMKNSRRGLEADDTSPQGHVSAR